MASFCCCGNSDVIVSPDHNEFSCLSNVAVVVTFPNLCKWQCSVGGIDPEKPYRATLNEWHLATSYKTTMSKRKRSQQNLLTTSAIVFS